MVTFPKVKPVSTEYLIKIVCDADRRTMDLIADLSDDQLIGPKLHIVNPMRWEIGHIAWFQENFIIRLVDGKEPIREDGDRLYDSMNVAHDTRWDLPLPDLLETRGYMEAVRDAVIRRLDDKKMASEQDSYFTQLVVFHQDMHNEALTYTRQTHGYLPPKLSESPEIRVDKRSDPSTAGPLPGDVDVPGGVHLLGAQPTYPYYMDNEKWAHGYKANSFKIARSPVTNEEYSAFVDDGGYEREELWSAAGWGWRNHADAMHPVYWEMRNDGWNMREFDQTYPLRPHNPVIHVCWFEADAYCRWAGRRLPWEGEWEVAASRAPQPEYEELHGSKRRYPWGEEPPQPYHANLDGWRNGTVDVAAFPESDSGYGCRQLIGNVWEWTASSFARYEGFSPDPYADYSAPWMDGKHAVLRGGSWATRSRVVWNTFRNFYTCDRRDVLAGFRTCAL